MDIVSALLVDAIMFGRSFVGLVTRPYETYRHIVKRARPGELVGVALLLSLYFLTASLVKVSAFRPFLLTKHFVFLAAGAASGIMLASCSLYVGSKLFRVRAAFSTILVSWSYTLIPTVLWFLATSVLYVVLPPPRTTSAMGMAFSLLFLVFSTTLLWWKITLSYLAIRFTLKLDFIQSLALAGVCAPFLAFWAYVMYKLGIFKVPFL